MISWVGNDGVGGSYKKQHFFFLHQTNLWPVYALVMKVQRPVLDLPTTYIRVCKVQQTALVFIALLLV